MTELCNCAACNALALEYATDPGLLAFYRKRLLVRGWAGRKTPTEKAYILAHAPFAQAGAANLARRRFSCVDPAGTDGLSTEEVAD